MSEADHITRITYLLRLISYEDYNYNAQAYVSKSVIIILKTEDTPQLKFTYCGHIHDHLDSFKVIYFEMRFNSNQN